MLLLLLEHEGIRSRRWRSTERTWRGVNSGSPDLLCRAKKKQRRAERLAAGKKRWRDGGRVQLGFGSPQLWDAWPLGRRPVQVEEAAFGRRHPARWRAPSRWGKARDAATYVEDSGGFGTARALGMARRLALHARFVSVRREEEERETGVLCFSSWAGLLLPWASFPRTKNTLQAQPNDDSRKWLLIYLLLQFALLIQKLDIPNSNRPFLLDH